MDTRLVKQEFPLFRRLGRDFDWFLDRFGFDRPMFEGSTQMWTPYVEVFEKANEFVVRAELPGVKKKEIKVEIAEGELTIFGERCHSVFLGTIALPEGVKIENAAATVKDGVLEIKMPIARAETPRRRVEIKEGPEGEKATKHAA